MSCAQRASRQRRPHGLYCICRTALTSSVAINFVTADDTKMLREIEQF